MRNNRISTARLHLIAATYEHLRAELESPGHLEALLHAAIDPGWPPGEYDRSAQEFFKDKARDGGKAAEGWFCWYAIRKGTEQSPPVVIGAGGFFGPPNDKGEVEIGFSIMPAHRKQGYATELVNALAAWAFDDTRTTKIIARTTRGNTASCGIIKKTGFTQNDCTENNLVYVLAKNGKTHEKA